MKIYHIQIIYLKFQLIKNLSQLNLSHSLIIVCFELFKLIKPSFFKNKKKLLILLAKKLNIF